MPAERLPPEPAKLLVHWMEWEKGQASPGQTMADLKKGGLRDLLEALAEAAEQGTEPAGGKKA